MYSTGNLYPQHNSLVYVHTGDYRQQVLAAHALIVCSPTLINSGTNKGCPGVPELEFLNNL
jgi:hypothetical protein